MSYGKAIIMSFEIFAEGIEISKLDSRSFSADLTLPENLPVFNGHFPGNPILPGVAYVFLAEKLTSRFLEEPFCLKQLKKTKFFRPTMPGENLKIQGSISCDPADEKKINAQVTFSDSQMQRVCLVKMIMEK